MKIEFTNEELFLLSAGIIALIHNSTEAKKLIYDEAIEGEIELYQSKLTNLNAKICDAIMT